MHSQQATIKTMLLLAAVLCVGMVAGSPGGAPISACADMSPIHQGAIAQALPSPYTVSVSSQRVQPRAEVTVTITAATGDSFRGFFVQARDASDAPVGTFEVSGDVKVIDCLEGVQNAATHVLNDDKASVMIGWTAPSTPVDVTFT